MAGKHLLLAGLAAVSAGCAKTLRQPPPLASTPLSAAASFRVLKPEELPVFSDDLSSATLEEAAQKSLAYLSGLDPSKPFHLGPFEATPPLLENSVRRFLSLYKEASSPDDLRLKLSREFHVLESAGTNGRGQVLFTAYYEPILEARLHPEGRFLFPLYRKPPDLVEADLDRFDPKRQGERIWGKVQDGRLAPYLNRDQIDYQGALQGRGLELAWLEDPWDVMTAHIEGSSLLALPGGEILRAKFAASNGLPFKSPGMALVELGFLKREGLNAERVKKYLDEHPGLRREVLSRNPRYTFFQLEKASPGGPLGTIRQPLTGERSLAVDASLIPLGLPAYYALPLGGLPAARFAFCQDTGGAILGPGRVDIFMGSGPRAQAAAGQVLTPGRLYVFLLKPSAESAKQ